MQGLAQSLLLFEEFELMDEVFVEAWLSDQFGDLVFDVLLDLVLRFGSVAGWSTTWLVTVCLLLLLHFLVSYVLFREY